MNQSNRPFSGLRAPASARALILALAVSALFPSVASAAGNESPAADKAAAASSEAPLAGAASSDASQAASASQAQAGESAPLSQAEIQAAIRAQLPGAASTPSAVSEPSGSHVARKEFKLPGTHWVNQHLDFVHPRNSAIATGSAPSALETASVDLSGVSVTDGNGNAVTLADYQNRGDVDSLLVLHRGQIVYEHYAHGMIEERRHALWSMTKSFTGLIATDLIQSGQLDPSAPITQYVPELQGSAWDGASVQQTLDMTTAVDYAERPDADPGVVQYMFAADLLNVGPLYQGPKKIIDFLKSLKKNGDHGAKFEYKTVDAEVIGLIIEKITGKSFPTLVSERIWAPIGAQTAAYALQDSGNAYLAGAGMGAITRDLARFGEAVRLEGRYNGQAFLQPGTVAELRKGGDQSAFRAGRPNAREGASYHNQWWIAPGNDHSFEAQGFGGQRIYIDPQNELVIVKTASEVNLNIEPKATDLDRPIFDAITTAVTQAH